MSKVGSRNSEVGSPKSDVGSLTVGSQKSEVSPRLS